MSTNEGRAVARAARKAASAREELERAMKAAHAAGLTLRAIAAEAQVSYETVRRVVAP